LFKLRESPEKFKWAEEHPEPPTPALVFGQLLHAIVLQPEAVERDFAVTPNIDRRTKGGKEMWADFEASAEGKTIVTTDMVEQAVAMRDKLMSNDYVRQLLDGEREKPFFWTDELTQEECKCRVDCLSHINGMDIIVDLKTAENADTDTFMRHAIKYGYNLQAAMYGEGVKANTGKEHAFVFIVIEKKPPYAINIMQADKAFVLHGFDMFRELIGTYHECKVSGNWWGYLGKHNIINNLPLPAYLAKEIE
jgi:exodeoxyribonuclease VIII